MSAVAIIRALLVAHSALTDVIPAERIKPAYLPLKTPLPAILVMPIDSQPRNTLAMTESGTLNTDRVQVAVHIREVDDGFHTLRGLLDLVRAACPNTRGTVDTFYCDSILPDQEGPYLSYGDGFAEQSRDFIVRWST